MHARMHARTHARTHAWEVAAVSLLTAHGASRHSGDNSDARCSRFQRLPVLLFLLLLLRPTLPPLDMAQERGDEVCIAASVARPHAMQARAWHRHPPAVRCRHTSLRNGPRTRLLTHHPA